MTPRRAKVAAAAAAPLTAAAFCATTAVSRETGVRLEAYARLLVHWQETFNLVGRASLADLWRRHFLDSAQLRPLLLSQPTIATALAAGGAPALIDLGSGAGFPGLVLAIIEPRLDVHLIESNGRKCAFLRAVARATGTRVTVHDGRIETIAIGDAGAPPPAAAITARGCAPLPRLLELAAPLLDPTGVCLFLKGRRANEELTAAAKTWKISHRTVPSLSDASGVVVILSEIVRERS